MNSDIALGLVSELLKLALVLSLRVAMALLRTDFAVGVVSPVDDNAR